MGREAKPCIMLPLERNIPAPKNRDWKLVQCPICGKNCWESDLAREVMALYQSADACCTECALSYKRLKGKGIEKIENE